MRSLPRFAAISATIMLMGASSLWAQDGLGFRGWGLRGGATIEPDQVHGGIHIDAGQFAPRVSFQPSFEVGFGNDLIVGAINLDAFYTFSQDSWKPYLGGGLGVALIDVDRDRRGDDFHVEAGLNLVAGFFWGARDRYLLEMRAGVGDIPDFKVTAGIGF